jgi:hypothetical protein
MERKGPKSPKVRLAQKQKAESKPKQTREEKIRERYANLTEGKYLNVKSLLEVKGDYKYFNYDKANMLAYENDTEEQYEEVLNVLDAERASGDDLIEATKSKPVKGQGGKKKKRGPKKTTEEKFAQRIKSRYDKYEEKAADVKKFGKKGPFLNVRTVIWIKAGNPRFNYDTDNYLAYENDMRDEYLKSLEALGLEEGTIIEASEEPKERKERKKREKKEKKEKPEKKSAAKPKAKPKSKRAAIKPKKDEDLKEAIEKKLAEIDAESAKDKYKGKRAYINLTPTSNRFVMGGQSKYNYDSQGFAYTNDNKEQYEKVLALLELEPMPEEVAEEEEEEAAEEVKEEAAEEPEFEADEKLAGIATDIAANFNALEDLPGTNMRKAMSEEEVKALFFTLFNDHMTSDKCTGANISRLVEKLYSQGFDTLAATFGQLFDYFNAADKLDRPAICRFIRGQVQKLEEGDAGAEEVAEGKRKGKVLNHKKSPSRVKSMAHKKIKISPPRRPATSPKTKVRSY